MSLSEQVEFVGQAALDMAYLNKVLVEENRRLRGQVDGAAGCVEFTKKIVEWLLRVAEYANVCEVDARDYRSMAMDGEAALRVARLLYEGKPKKVARKRIRNETRHDPDWSGQQAAAVRVALRRWITKNGEQPCSKEHTLEAASDLAAQVVSMGGDYREITRLALEKIQREKDAVLGRRYNSKIARKRL